MAALILPLCLVQAQPYNKVKAPVIQLDMTRIFSNWNYFSPVLLMMNLLP